MNPYYVPKASYYGTTLELAGEPEQARVQFENALAQVRERLAADPDDPRYLIALGEVLVGLGDTDAAIDNARRAMELVPRSTDYMTGAAFERDAAIRIFARLGEREAVLNALDSYFSNPGFWSIEGVRLDPRLDPLRDDPRFEALVEKYRRNE